MPRAIRTFYEFFAGGGMARAGLGGKWRCTFANDFDAMKTATYTANWGSSHLVCGDVAGVSTSQLPGTADLAWASFPCQDLSLAGSYLGLGKAKDTNKTRSGTFWPFWNLMKGLSDEGRAPRIVVLENVHGVLTSRSGKDFAAIGNTLHEAGYRFGALAIDAERFLPQSRPRVFVVAVKTGVHIPCELISSTPSQEWHPTALVAAQKLIAPKAQHSWIWWKLKVPPMRAAKLLDIVEDHTDSSHWNSPSDTARLLGMMSPTNAAKVTAARRSKDHVVGTIYRRTRADASGRRQQRAEVRFDGVAGCLRTPGGGSSRQTIIEVQGSKVRTRLLSPREAARLMGLPDDYTLPLRYNDAYHVCGDGVVVPVVRHLSTNLIEPILAANEQAGLLAAE